MSHPKTPSNQTVNLLDRWNEEYIKQYGEPLEVGSRDWLGIAYTDVARIVKEYFKKTGRFGASCTLDELVTATWRRIELHLLPDSLKKRGLLTESFIRQSASYSLRDFLRQPFVKRRLEATAFANASESGLSDILNNVMGGSTRTPSRVMIAQEESDQLCDLLVTILNENDLLLMILRHFMDYSFKEISLLFDRSEHALRGRYSYVLGILRPEFAKQFPTKFATAQRLGNASEMDADVREFVATLGKHALACQWDQVHACLAPWLQDQLTPCAVQEFFGRAYNQTLADHGIAAEHFPEGLDPEIGGSEFVTADKLRQPIDWLGDRTRDIPEGVTNENMRFWARLTLLGSEAQSQQLQIETFAEIWIAVVETEGGLRVGYWSQSAYEVQPPSEVVESFDSGDYVS